jgi:hypothetical protein
MGRGSDAGRADVTNELGERVTPASPSPARRRAPIIEANGSEYLVTINGSVFLALSLTQARTIAYRMGHPRRDDSGG